ncbi:MAG: endolytic transglycosylase MltG [Nitrospirae bacterium]|nr:endolytic transglycosylase MltG [Nitrospirota bacterium]
MKGFFGRKERAFIICNLIIFILLFAYLKINTSVLPRGEWKEIGIPEGANYRQVLRILKENKIIKNDLLLLLLGKALKTDTRLRAGYYKLSASLTPWDIFKIFRDGNIVEYTVTIPEGSSLDAIKSIFAETNLLDNESWELVDDPAFLEFLGVRGASLEGYIYPDTYKFAKGANPRDILTVMVDMMRQKFDSKLRERAREIGMSENEVLTLASIIEKEACVDSERALISAVYHNRLKKNMKLQADPTVQYGTERAGCKILKQDLKNETPFNTYVITGLPPGPIASPGLKSIKAALYPAEANYLFFVSKNDGTHHFSHTGEEHVAAVALYQKNGAASKDEPKEKTE